MADQFRADALACVGGYGRTDALDGLAREGVLFRRAVTNSPECVPARFALATGLYPHQTGVRRNGHHNMHADAPSWIRTLAEAGYRTSLFGKSHFYHAGGPHHDLRDALPLMHALGLHDVDEIVGPRALMRDICKMTEGWREAGVLELFREDIAQRLTHEPLVARPSPLGVAHHYDTYVGEAARQYLTEYDRAQPWFCWVSFAGPHEPWDAPAPYDEMHGPAPAPIPPYPGNELTGGLLDGLRHSFPALDAEQINAMRRNYAGKVTLIDEQIGKLLMAVKERGEDDNTLILFVSDHGEMNGDHGLFYKSNFLSPAVDIPLIIRPPGGIEGRVSEALVELIDTGATVLDYAGCAKLEGSGARSIRPVVTGEQLSHRDFVLSEFRHNSMVSDAEFKAEFNAHGEVKLLFDLRRDAAEQHNLAAAPEFAFQAERLAAAWRGMLHENAAEIQVG